MTASKPSFRIALTADFYDPTGQLKYRDIGLDLFAQASGTALAAGASKESANPEPVARAIPLTSGSSDRYEVTRFAEHHPEITPEQLDGVNGVIVLTPRVTANTLSRSENLLAVARFGVGYDNVDVAACTAADVVLFITAGAVDYSVAEATLGWMLALVHRVRIKDRLVREARWDERSQYMGQELRGRTIGVVGFGGIGRALLKLLAPFKMTALVFDPFVSPQAVGETGASAVSLDELLARSDFVSLHCPLNDKTRNLISARELSLMKRTAYLINTARGGIVEEGALYSALSSEQIAGAALDCFVGEPLTAPPTFAGLDNVLLAPHCIAWSDDLFRELGRADCQGLIDLAHGRRPHGVVNPEVFESPGFIEKWNRLRVPRL